MTRITNVDQVLVLLRSHLDRTERSKRARKTGPVRKVRRSPIQRVSELAASDHASEEDIHRALISGILTEELGAGFANDARFQDLVSDIMRTLTADEKSRALLRTAVSKLSDGP